MLDRNVFIGHLLLTAPPSPKLTIKLPSHVSNLPGVHPCLDHIFESSFLLLFPLGTFSVKAEATHNYDVSFVSLFRRHYSVFLYFS